MPQPLTRTSKTTFEEMCRLALRQAKHLSPAARESIVEDLRIRFQHPGEYVAYVNRWKIVDKVRRLTREVLAHSPTLAGIQHVFANCSEREGAEIILDYADDPHETTLELPYDLPAR